MTERDTSSGPTLAQFEVVKPKRTAKPDPAEAPGLVVVCHEVVNANLRGSDDFHVCTIQTTGSPYMHAGGHACPCGFVWGWG